VEEKPGVVAEESEGKSVLLEENEVGKEKVVCKRINRH
jgi:hypothetical protein